MAVVDLVGVSVTRTCRLCSLLILLACVQGLTAHAAADVGVAIKALDPEGIVLTDIRFAYQGVASPPTTSTGVTELRITVAPGQSLQPGSALELDLPQEIATTWFLINDTIHVPGPGQPPAEAVLFRRSDMRRLAEKVRDAEPTRGADLRPEDRQRIVLEYAAQYGLSQEDLDAVIASFRETATDPMDEGVALFLAREFAQAEPFFRTALEGAEERKRTAEEEKEEAEAQIVAAADYLGQVLYEQGQYAEAAEKFRRALALKPDDTGLISWLGNSLMMLAEWSEAEVVLNRGLALAEASCGPNHPSVATGLDNLAHLLYVTNRLAEAEPLLRRALEINEASFGADHPNVAAGLDNLAQLLQETNRLAEAEPLLRRALEINEASFGVDHPNVATRLNNLALLLQETNRLAEAEPLLRRALEIDEISFGPSHPEVARDLNNLAMLFQETNRLADAEPLMRRTLEIYEASLGADHPNVATGLNNLAALLQDTNRLAEAEPLMRRALEIYEASFGADHPRVATGLNNLALLLQETNRLAEAEPLMRRAVEIAETSLPPGHPWLQVFRQGLLCISEELERQSTR